MEDISVFIGKRKRSKVQSRSNKRGKMMTDDPPFPGHREGHIHFLGSAKVGLNLATLAEPGSLHNHAYVRILNISCLS
jgi:tRNA U34 2-thiouridine synthase MnmA/TrmU